MQTYSFPSTIPAREMQRKYKQVFETVRRTKKPIVVVANNKPQGAVISLEMLKNYNHLLAEANFFAAIEEIRAANTDKDPNEVAKDVNETVEEVRQEIYDKTFGGR